MVEVRRDWAVEGVWDGAFDKGDCNLTDSIYGTGIRNRDVSMRKKQINFWRFLCSIILPGLIAAGVFTAVCLCVLHLWSPYTWLLFGCQVFFVSTVCFFIFVFVLLPGNIRLRFFAKPRFKFAN